MSGCYQGTCSRATHMTLIPFLFLILGSCFNVSRREAEDGGGITVTEADKPVTPIQDLAPTFASVTMSQKMM